MREISTDLDIYKGVRGGLKTTKQLLFLPHFPKLNKFVKEYGKENKQTEFHLEIANVLVADGGSVFARRRRNVHSKQRHAWIYY